MTTVVVPAHNEAATITRCLTTLLADAEPGEFGILVAANGCTDTTVELTRRFAHDRPDHEITVLDLAEPSKVAALNAALDTAPVGIVIVVDADVTLATAGVRELEAALAPDGVLAASTRLAIDPRGASAIVRSYHRFWAELPAIARGLSGRGVYALADQGRARLGRFPPILGDDALVDRLFSDAERTTVQAASTITLSATTGALIARKIRVFAGNDELDGIAVDRRTPSSWTSVVRANPGRAIDLPAYLGINAVAKVWARIAARLGGVAWGRDPSGR